MYVYQIKNEITKMKYIGVTKDVENRFLNHLRELNRTTRPAILTHPLYVDLKKYSKENFSLSVLEEVSEEESYLQEQYWIKKLNTLHPNGYNLTTGGEENKEYSNRTKTLIGKEKKEDWENIELAKRMREGLRKGTETVKNRSRQRRLEVKQVAISWAKENPDIILSLPGKRKKDELYPLWKYIEEKTGMKDKDTINKAINGSMSTVMTFEMLQNIAKKA